MKIVFIKQQNGLFPLTDQDKENLARIKNGNLYAKDFKKVRNPDFHRLVFEFLTEIFKFQDEFNDFERFRKKVKRLIGDYKEQIIEEKKGVIKIEIDYLSWNFGKMDEYEFKARFEKMKTACAHAFCKTNEQFEIINRFD
jgi:hypothetical protein